MRTAIRFYSPALTSLVLLTLAAPLSAVSPGLLHAPFDNATAKAKQLEWAKHLTREVAEQNSIGMELVLIPPGVFELGSSETLQELSDAFPIIGINAKGVEFRNVIE